MKKIAIVGGGASGLIAAYYASSEKTKVVIFEKQKKIGRKLLVTGNGRCNISNRHIDTDRYHGNNPDFVRNIFSRYSLEDTINFFQSIGMPLIEEDKGKLFPSSLQSSTVVKLLEYELRKKKVDIQIHRRIDSILPKNGSFILTTAGKEKYTFNSVILSAGSCAYSPSGASKIGYELAESLGHTVHDPFPALLPLNIPLKILHKLQGIKWICAVSLHHNGKIIETSSGELLFTGFGISGPAALDISRTANELVLDNKCPEIKIDLYQKYKKEELMDILESLWMDKNKTIAFSLLGIMKQNMPEIILTMSEIDPLKKVGNISSSDKKRLVETMKELTVEPGKPRDFKEAVVAAGGVDVNELNPKTMESKKIKNLFITGELLDIDGDSGGYNLQFAWSTGAIAGMAQI